MHIFNRTAKFSVHRDWIKYSYNYYKSLIEQKCGISEINGFTLSSSSDDDIMVNRLQFQLNFSGFC